MLVELSVMEQRYHAVLEVVSEAPVTEVARRYGVSRQAVHGRLGRYEREGLAGLADHSHRPAISPASRRLLVLLSAFLNAGSADLAACSS